MVTRQGDDERLLVQRGGFDARFVKRIGDDDGVERALLERLEQVGGEIFFDNQLQIGCGFAQLLGIRLGSR